MKRPGRKAVSRILLAVVGLGYVWLTGWKRGKQLYTSFFTEGNRSIVPISNNNPRAE